VLICGLVFCHTHRREKCERKSVKGVVMADCRWGPEGMLGSVV